MGLSSKPTDTEFITIGWNVQKDWDIEYISPSIRQFGYSMKDIMQKKIIWQDIVDPVDFFRINEEFQRAARAKGEVVSRAYRIYDKNKKLVYVQDYIQIFYDDNNMALSARACIVNVTASKENVENMQILEECINRNKTVLILWEACSDTSRIKYLSENIIQYGYPYNDYINNKRQWTDNIYAEDKERVQQEAAFHMMNGNTRFKQEYRVQSQDGQIIWVCDETAILRQQDTSRFFIESMIQNITYYKNLELERSKMTDHAIIKASIDEESDEDIRERLRTFIENNEIRQLQDFFAISNNLYAALIGDDMELFTEFSGPGDNLGMFYDISELGEFKQNVEKINSLIELGKENILIPMKQREIKLSGVPLYYQGERIATWIVGNVRDTPNKDIFSKMNGIKVLAQNISNFFNNNMGETSIKNVARERRKAAVRISMSDLLIRMYEDIFDQDDRNRALDLAFDRAGLGLHISRIAIYAFSEAENYSVCEYEWKMPAKDGYTFSQKVINEKEISNSYDRLLDEGIAVIDKKHMDGNSMRFYNNYGIKAAVLVFINFGKKNGFVAFEDYINDRLWDEDVLECIKNISVLIEKILNKN